MYDFNQIIGHGHIIKNLRSSIAHGRINHAYLFEGEKGAGKMLLAQAFAKALLCERRSGGVCNSCVSCITFDSGNQPDVLYVRPTKTKALGVDDIREQVNREIATKPYQYDYKIFIIENADGMTPAAQNALLKTLEEPAPYGVFLLTAENANRLLPTVLSRCFTVKLKPLPFEDVKGYLIRETGLSEETAHFISVYAGGSIGQAVTVAADEKFVAMRGVMLDILDGITERDLADVFAQAKALESMKENIADALNIAFLWYRDIAVLKELNDDTMILQKDIRDRLSENINISAETVYNSLDAIAEAKHNLRFNANFQLAAEVLLMKLNAGTSMWTAAPAAGASSKSDLLLRPARSSAFLEKKETKEKQTLWKS
ncbi:MAG: DNA polymerase III subunit delta' [Clostridiales bacterium]|jgi:DNA polymerase-3 subunit delta'|nr:DNA polymerase III subunit delta' [Clostridiales bacterium]